MARGKSKAKRRRRAGPRRSLPRNAAAHVRLALKSVMRAKDVLRAQKGGLHQMAAFRELHHVESRLSRMA